MLKQLIGIFFLFLSFNVWGQSDTTAFYDIDLESLMKMKVVTASKNKESIQHAPAVMSVITAKEIEAFGAMKLWEVLDRMTSIYVIGTYFSPQGMVTMRGKKSDNYNTKVLILMDGRPMRESLTGGYNNIIYDMFPLAQIERLEIIRGPGSVLYGTNAYAGAINIITKTADHKKIYASARYGSFNTTQAQIGICTKKKELGISFGATGIYSEGWEFTARGEKDVIRNKTNTADSILRNPTTIKRGDKGIGATLKLDYKGLTCNNFFAVNSTTAMGRMPVWSKPAEYELENKRILSDLSYTKELTKVLSLTANLTYNHLSYRNFGIGNKEDYLRRYSNDMLIEVSTQIRPSPKLNIILGGLSNYQTGKGLQTDLSATGQTVDVSNTYNPDPWVAIPAYHTLWYSTYAQADYSPVKFLKLIAGGQINKITSIKLDFVPRLGAILTINENLGIKLLSGQAFRSSTAFERSSYSPGSIYGNSMLTPEKISTYEAEIYYTSARYAVSATAFSNHDNNIISRQNIKDTLSINGASVPFSQKYINSGSEITNGLEVEAKANIVRGISLYGSATYLTSINDAGKKDYAALPNTMAKLGALFNYREKAILGLYASYYGSSGDYYIYSSAGTPRTSIVNPAAEPYADISANLNMNLRNIFGYKMREVILQCYATNLLNTSIFYPETVRRNINTLPGRAGRAFNIGLAIKM